MRYHISVDASTGGSQQFDMPAGSYDIEVSLSSGLTITAGTPSAALHIFASAAQSGSATAFGGSLAATVTTSVIPIEATTPTHFVITPQTGAFTPAVVPYGMNFVYTNGTTVSGTLTGEILVRRR